MLETDDVDIDFFTPAASASLATIFGKSSVTDETKENTSLKYVPPPPPERSKLEEMKPAQWIFTCAVQGFEWFNSSYINRGKLGFAMYNPTKTDSPFMILYDANKTTVSCTEISPKLHVHIRDVLTISYYDSAQRYWSIKTSNNDMDKILKLLKDLHATVMPPSCQEVDREQSNNGKVQNKDDATIKDEGQKEEHDTDFYNQKTKDSILKRMANVGHSVLPPQDILKEHASDSSNSNDIEDSKKNIRHKLVKIPPKRSTDINVQEIESNIASHSRKPTHRTHSDGLNFVPAKNTTKTCGGDMNIFISEQKISNSELRINLNRASDKIDVVLDKINEIALVNRNNPNANFQMNIVHKLVNEYERKIMFYEHVMSSRGIDIHAMQTPVMNHFNERDSYTKEVYTMKIDELERKCREKDNTIKELEREICGLNAISIKTNESNHNKVLVLQKKIEELNEELNLKNKEIYCNKSSQQEGDITNKIKKIMNDTYDAISGSFDDKETYSGETIKAIIARVIKKTTIQALQEL